MYLFPVIFAPFDASWYDSLIKPSYTPPRVIFSGVWIILYILLSLAATLTLLEPGENEDKNQFVVILILNYLFLQLYNYLMFGVKNIMFASIDILLVLFTTVLLYYSVNKINKRYSYLLIPLLIWVIFASFLQIGFLKLN